MEDQYQNILEGCKKNDRRSQEKLYRQFYPALFALCKMFFEDNHDIITALNNGMMKVFKNIEKYDATKGDFFNWTYTSVRNAALTLIRDKKLYIISELNESMINIPDSNPFKKAEWKDIYVYLENLPPATRAICCLFYIEGFSIQEIVTALNIKEGTVKWHLNESRNKLKSIFQTTNQLL